jgi:hypothetical protein
MTKKMTTTFKTTLFAAAVLSTIATSSSALADAPAPLSPTSSPAAEPTPPATEDPATYATPAPLPAPAPAQHPRANRGKFSGGRFILNSLAGGLVGGLVGYATFQGLGGDNIGAAFAGLGTQILVTPLVVYGAGRMQGGEGTLGSAYLGGLVAFSGPAATTEQAAVSFAVGMLLMPFTSALMYEISSSVRSKRFETVAKGLQITPVVDGNGVAGMRAGLSFGF